MQVCRASVLGSTAQCAAQTAKRTATSVSRAVLRLKAGQMASAQVSLYHARSVAVFKRTNIPEAVVWGLLREHNRFNDSMPLQPN